MKTAAQRLYPTQVQEITPDPGLTLSPEDYSLLTDLYQLTMAACYVGEKLDQRWASFELFTRRLPNNFGYLIAMGLAQALDYLETFRFSPSQIEALQATEIFTHAPTEFWSLLAAAKFTGDVWAVPEGTAVFANEPLLRIEAPLWQAQLVETYLLNTLNYQTLIATKAARLRDVAGPQTCLLEFGTRRAFSPQASLWAARAALAAGLDATSNVLAALKLGRKPSGTMAHALVMAISALEGTEADAFAAFHQYFPGAPLLIDTYDTMGAARQLSEKFKRGEIQLSGVRLDSGDLVLLSQQIRELLPGVPIFASGDLDEGEIARLQSGGACIDGYGLGTKLVTGVPVNGVYKLVEIDGIPVMKESSGKLTYPGCKQIWRQFAKGQMQVDYLTLAEKNSPEFAAESTDDHGGKMSMLSDFESSQSPLPLMQLVMRGGQRLQSLEPLEVIAQRTAASVASLPVETRRLSQPVAPEIKISAALQALTQKTKKTL